MRVDPSSVALQLRLVAPRLQRDAAPPTFLAPKSDVVAVRHDDANVLLFDVGNDRFCRFPWRSLRSAVRARVHVVAVHGAARVAIRG